MSFLNVNPGVVADAVGGLEGIGSTIDEAVTGILPATGSLLPAGSDSISALVSTFFGGKGVDFQAITSAAAELRTQLTQTLSQAMGAYGNTEGSNVGNLVRGEITQLENQLGVLQYGVNGAATPIPPSVTNPTLVIGGTGYATVPQNVLGQVRSIYYPTGGNLYSLNTPEAFFPFTPQLGSYTLNQSVRVGQQELNSAIMSQLGMGHNVNVWGTSQGALVETNEIRYLMAHGSPGVNQLKFTLTGDPGNPDGGLYERFNGLRIPPLGVHFNGATPPNSPYTTSIYTNQYDGVADFPRYPLNVVSDLNAVMGFGLGPHDYTDGVYNSLGTVQLPTSPGYTGHTSYYFSPTQNLPLLDPLRYGAPQPYGNALADLFQPDLRVIVDMGYGSHEYANIPTHASLLEFPNPVNIGKDLGMGTVQGPQQALVDLGLLPGSYNQTGHYPYSPVVDPHLNYPLPQQMPGLLTPLKIISGTGS